MATKFREVLPGARVNEYLFSVLKCRFLESRHFCFSKWSILSEKCYLRNRYL